MNASLWQLAGWTMIHSLWLGAAVAIIGGFLRLAARRATPSTRYAISLATLAALAISPLSAAAWLSVNGVPQLAPAAPSSVLLPPPRGSNEHDRQWRSSAGGSPSVAPGWGGGPPPVSGPQFASSTGDTQDTIQTAYPLLHPSLTLPLEGRGPEDIQANAPAPVVIDLAHSDPSPRYSGERLGEGQNPLTSMPPAATSVFPDATVENPSPTPSLPGRGTPAPLPASHQSPITDYLTPLSTAIPYLPILWLVGAPLTFTLLAAGLVGSERLRRRATPLVAGPAFDACQRMRTALRITRRVALAACDGVAQPVLVGVFRPLILLPTAALAGWTPEQLDMILLHELAHVRRWDNLVNLLQRIVESLLFYHPAAWILSRQVRHDREECCDATVIRHTDRPHQYAELLVSTAAALRGGPAPSLAVASAMASHPLAGRIRRILNIEAEPMRITRRTLAATLLLPALLAGAILYSGANAEDGNNSPPSQEQPTTLASDEQAQSGSVDAEEVPDANEPSTPASDERAKGDSTTPTFKVEPSSAEQQLAALLARIDETRQKIFLARKELLEAEQRAERGDRPAENELFDAWFDEQWKDHYAATTYRQLGGSIVTQLRQREKAGVASDDPVTQQLKASLKQVISDLDQAKTAYLEEVRDEFAKLSEQKLFDLSSAVHSRKAKKIRLKADELQHEFDQLNEELRQFSTSQTPAEMKNASGLGSANQNAATANSPADNAPPTANAAPESAASDWNAQPPAFKPILTHNLSNEASAALIGGYGILQEFPANAPQSAVDADVNRLKAENRRFSVEQSEDGRRRIVDQTPPPEMEILREIRRLESLVNKAQDELTDLEVRKQLAIEGASSPALTEQAIAQELEKDQTLKTLNDRLLNIDRFVASEESHLADDAADRDRETIDNLSALRKATAAKRDAYRTEAVENLRERIAKMPNETLRSAIVEYKVRRKAVDEKLAKHQQELDAARQKFSQLGVGRASGTTSTNTDDAVSESFTASSADRTSLQNLAQSEEELKKVFESRPDNPSQNVNYATDKIPQQDVILYEDMFEGLQKDPYGPQLVFTYNATADHKHIKITAPREAHRQFFKPIFAGELPKAAQAATDPALQPLLTPEDVLKKELADTRQRLKSRLAELKAHSADDLQKIRSGAVPELREEDESSIALREKVQAMSEARMKSEDAPAPSSPVPDAAATGSPGSPNQSGAATGSLDNDEAPAVNASPGSDAADQVPEPSTQPTQTATPTPAPDPRLANLLPLSAKDFAAHFVFGSDNQLSEYSYEVDPDMLPAIRERLDAALDLLRTSSNPTPKFVVNYRSANFISIIAAERAQQSLLVDQTTGRPVAGLKRVGRSYSSPATHFPTLENQKIADRAYKLLGLELEPLNPEDLERVKKLGYTGGLCITRANQMGGTRTDDLLVGLHVWPITDLKSLDEVLQRDDLNELNPLKYYVIRNMRDPAARGGGGGGFGGGPMKDALVTGRLQIPEAELLSRGLEQTNQVAEQLAMLPPPAGSIAPDTGQPTANAPAFNESLPSTAPTFIYDGKTFEQWRDLWKNELNPERRADAISALSAFSRAGRSDDAINAILDVAAEYDFSYPDDSHSQGEEKLKKRIVEELTVPDDFNQPRDPWIPLLMNRMKQDPKKWQNLAQRLYTRMGPPYRGNSALSPQNLELLKRCAADPAFGPNVDMLTMLYWSAAPNDEEVKQLAKKTLTAEDTVNALKLLRNMGFGRLEEFPAQFDFLFNEDPEIRKSARTTLNWVSNGETYEAIVPKLLAILEDPDQSSRHADAIRALAAIAMRNSARGVGPPLLTSETHAKVAERMGAIFSDGPPELLPPAFIALQSLMGQNQEQFLQLVETQPHSDRMALLKEAVKALPAETETIIAPPSAANHGRDGGGMGGGGMGGGGGFF